MTKNNRLRRALRAFDRFTLLTLNPVSPYHNAFTGQSSTTGNDPRG